MTTRNDRHASADAAAAAHAEPDGAIASTARLPGLGIIERTGADAAAHARSVAREAQHAGEPDPLYGLVERITASSDPSLAFDPLVIGDAVALRDDDGARFQSLRASLRRAGVSLTEWTRALDVEARRRKAASKEAEREGALRAALVRRDAAEAGRLARAGEIEVAREARPDLAAHYRQVEVNGVTYSMTPGRVVMESMTSHGVRVVELANFSCPIVAHTIELETPNAGPRTIFTLSVLLGDGGTPREVDIHAERFTHMEWVEPTLGPRAVVAAGKGTRDHLRAALGYLSSPETRCRRGYIGWTFERGEPVYVSAGAAIGARGAVAGLSATPADPIDRFVLPAPPVGAERERAIGALVSLLAMEPAKVTVPMVALAFHAPLGGSRCAVHVTGKADLGKSSRASLVQRLFGAGMFARNVPASWSNGSTAIGIAHVLARAGDALVLIDDLKLSGGSRDAELGTIVDHVFRTHFNGSTPLKGRREGGGRTDPASRCDVLSTGETLPKGSTASTLNRVLTVELASSLPGNIGELHARANAGELAAAMAAFLQWLAPQITDLRPRARDEEWDAAMRWGFTAGNRATELLGGLCLGMEFLLRFLGDSGVSAAAVEAHRARARAALEAVAMEHGHRVAEEDPAVRFIDLIGQGLRTGACHVVAVAPAPSRGGKEQSATPPEPARWGYQRAHDVLRPCGLCIGYLNPRVPGAVCLEPGAALALARKVAEGTGRQLGVDERSLGMALHAAGMLARHELDGARRKPTVRPRIFGSQPEVWAVKLEALGYSCTPDDTPDGPPGAVRIAPGAEADDDEVPPFPADLE